MAYAYDPMSDFYNAIDLEKFRKESPTIFMGTKEGKRKAALVLKKKLEGTYFDWLPLELVFMIFETERQMEIDADIQYYMKHYFTLEQINIETLRYLRPTEYDWQAKERGEACDFKMIRSPLGLIFGRRIWKPNMAGKCVRDFSDICIRFDRNKLKGLKMMYNLIVKHALWMCDQSFSHTFKSCLISCYRKTYEFERRLKAYCDGTIDENLPKELASKRAMTAAIRIIDTIKYYLEHYIPYMILTRSDICCDAIDEYTIPGRIRNMLYMIYELTDIHPNTINFREVKEFEMKIYAPKYYKNTYENYMKLRSGTRLIPNGEKPAFYWCANKYIQRFL